MFSRTIRIFFAAFIVFCVVPMAAFAQDDPDSPPRQPVSQQESNLQGFTASEILGGAPDTLQALLDAGYTSDEIENIQSRIRSSSNVQFAGVATSQTNQTYPVPCNPGLWANILLQCGRGASTINHTFQDGQTIVVGTFTCNDDVCWYVARTRRNGVSTAYFSIHFSTTYNHKIHSWCSTF